MIKILLLDIETSPNSVHVWGLWQQNVSINQIMESSRVLCWSAKWLGEKPIFFDSVNKSKEKDMLKKIHALISEADAVVHYNGTRFDMPTLNKEFLLNGMTPPSPYKQIDLLRTMKSQFRFPSNKLDYVAQRLGLGAKTKHSGHELWVKCMNNDVASWKVMEKYNKQDVVLLEKVYEKILPWIKQHPNMNMYTEGYVCPTCSSSKIQRRGTNTTNAGVYQRYQCTDCGTWSQDKKNQKKVGIKHIV